VNGLFIVAFPVIVKSGYLNIRIVSVATILGCLIALGYFFVDFKRLRLDLEGSYFSLLQKGEPFWTARRTKRQFFLVIVLTILVAFVYRLFYENKYDPQEYRILLLIFTHMIALSCALLSLIIIVFLERKYGPIYFRSREE
jgi:hypothetical protein